MKNIFIEDLPPDEAPLKPVKVSKKVSRRFVIDPSSIGFPNTLPIEVALAIQPVDEILDAYNISQEQWEVIREDPVYIEMLANAREMLKKDGMSFKVKAKLQAEELLASAWTMIHDPDTPYTVKADLIKSVIRWAGYEAQAIASAGEAGNGFSISINFNGNAEPRKAIDITPSSHASDKGVKS